jgi:hypothetical protein
MDFVAIDRVGVELEGGWVSRPGNAAYHNDPSVHIAYGTNGATIIGEMVSAPMSRWEEISDWILATHPIAHNRSCGMHVHVSFKERRSYARLMDIKFYEYFIERMKAWGERAGLKPDHLFWERLDGLNQFAEKKFRPDVQAAQKFKAGQVRYTHLNYCFSLRKTIECRLAPVFKQARIAVTFAQELCNIYEAYLAATDYSEVVHRIDDLG